jgi:hypothetical protein
VEWEARGGDKGDASLRSSPARRFALKSNKKDMTIYWNSGHGLAFQYTTISDKCDTNTESFPSLRCTDTNDPGLDEKTFSTSSRSFQGKEIEVLEITDETDLPPIPDL